MGQSRRWALAWLFAVGALADPQTGVPPLDSDHKGLGDPDEEEKLPNGKSRADAIAKKEHEDEMKDAEQLVTLASQIRDELQKAGNFVVPISTLKKTEEIERLARKIRGRLKS